ncbi:MAG: hypothetical protein HYT71_02025 [Candidatus Aenigmarchaeota archaeon]|nr:hypothetical protein [Candidatus Aenigmarchaeota archaeon]
MMQQAPLVKRRFIDFLVNSGVIEINPGKMPEWAREQGLFMRFGRAIGTAKRMREFTETFYSTMTMAVGEEPDLVFGPAYKGVPIATLMALRLGNANRVFISYNLPENSSVSVPEMVGAYTEDVKPFARVWVPPMLDSKSLDIWASRTARSAVEFYEPGKDKPSGYGFNTIIADGSAVPAATALAYFMGTNADPDFAVVRRGRQSRTRAKNTFLEMKELYETGGMSAKDASYNARVDAMERLVVGQVRDHARYLWISPQIEENRGIRQKEFSGLTDQTQEKGKTYRAMVVDDSILTGESMRQWAEFLRIRYPNAQVEDGFAAVHFQLIPPNSRDLKGRNLMDVRRELQNHLPNVRAAIDSDTVMEYMHTGGKISDEIWAKYQKAKKSYGTDWSIGVLR